MSEGTKFLTRMLSNSDNTRETEVMFPNQISTKLSTEGRMLFALRNVLKSDFELRKVSATPISFEQLLKKANPNVHFSKEAQNAFQCYIEAVIRELIRAATPVSQYVKRDIILPEDISLVLRCRGTD